MSLFFLNQFSSRSFLFKATKNSFNSITVDGDTSTSDTVLLSATGQVIGQPIVKRSSDLIVADFYRALEEVCIDLAQQIVRDGEGAQKIINIIVSGAESKRAARVIGLAIANSPLVKTAVAGEDPNWGRVIMGIGKSGEKVDKNKISIKFGEFLLAENGAPVENINLDKIREYMKWDSIFIEINLNSGSDFFECYTCDFTHDYIDINADYKNST